MKFYFTVTLLSILVSLIFGEKFLKMYKAECHFSPKYVVNGTCSLKIKSREAFVANVDYDLLIDMRNVTVNIVL